MMLEITRRRFSRARALEAADWRRLVAAFMLLFSARLSHGVLPARRLLEKLNSLSAAAPTRPLSLNERRQVERFAWALAVAANHAPWRSDCLLRALAAAAWLKRRRLPISFYLGVNKTDGGLAAHAWLRSGDICVTGGDAEDYCVLIEPQRPDQFFK